MSGVVKIDEKFCNQDIQELYVSEGYSGKSIEIKINFKKIWYTRYCRNNA